jgi:hypothetical protein
VDSQWQLNVGRIPADYLAGRSSELKTMKTKTWTVITNTGKQADLESGHEKKEFKKPMHISASEFVHWVPPDSRIDDDSLRSLFKL